MYSVFTNFTRSGLRLPERSNLVNYSELSEFQCKVPFRSFSIKYVSGGTELYTINSRRFEVGSGQYLLANNFSNGSVEIPGRQPVRGICIDLEPALLQDVWATHQRPDAPIAEAATDALFDSETFFEHTYSAHATRVGEILQSLDVRLSKDPYADHRFGREFFLDFASRLWSDLQPIQRQLRSIPAVKSHTRKDLLRRLMVGRDFLLAHWSKEVSVAEAAQAGGLSEYHFFRLFRQVYGKSPWQFVIGFRMERAFELLHRHGMPVAAAAAETGFADVHAFSKAFRKHFGMSPGSIRKR